MASSQQRRLVADLHLHSRYSLATSPSLDIATLAATAAQKGIDLLAAPDFTHPAWRKEMRTELVDAGEGVFRERINGARQSLHFILVTEISCVWKQAGRSRRVHVLLMAPSFEAADAISARLSAYQDLESDGRPVIKLSAEDLYSLALEANDRCVMFPAHAWTPWYGVYGSKSGFDSLAECFGDHTALVPAIESGLSSTPQMSWAVDDIGDRAIVSFSDAHSPGTMGRELTIFDAQPSYESVRSALFENGVIETIEFHPEHGKYHLSGHRKCGVKFAPDATPADGRCPVCSRPLTLGVLHRISALSAGRVETATIGDDGLLRGNASDARPFRQLVPLRELLAQSLGVGVNTKRVTRLYDALTGNLGPELEILTTSSEEQISVIAGDSVAANILAVRAGNVSIEPGYDGVYGAVSALPNPKSNLTGHL